MDIASLVFTNIYQEVTSYTDWRGQIRPGHVFVIYFQHLKIISNNQVVQLFYNHLMKIKTFKNTQFCSFQVKIINMKNNFLGILKII